MRMRHYLASLVILIAIAASAHAQSPTPTSTPARRATPTPKPRVMVALVFGQSNAGNWGETRHRAHPAVRAFFRGRWSPAADPLPGADGTGGSVWTRLGDAIIAARLYDRVIFVPASIGGTEIAKWAPGGLLHEDLLRNIRTAQRAGLRFTHLLWHQGESDAVLGTDAESYRRSFLAMLAAIRKLGVDAPVFVALASRCGEYPPNEAIRAAQAALVNPALGIYAGPDTDQLGLEYRYDGCHFSAEGLAQHAQLWLDVLRAYEDQKGAATPEAP